ncbi:MAG TPA: carboxypeptidase-like regulatory domain-containing protein [Vicinamibacterales bacterium]|jgi:hypothetical protein|nr:carboxypeptidase-like regulatory domain-containing protein [Vicinamibacterales bacterium]
MRVRLRHSVLTLALGAAAVGLACGGSPTAPCTDQQGRGDTTLNSIKVSCAASGAQLQCEADAFVQGLYVYCPMQQDVTQAAEWIAGDSTVIRAAAPGVFTALAAGHTFVHGTWHGLDSDNFGRTPVAVFPGTAPLPTYEIFGNVSIAGQTPSSSPVTGAVIEVLDGLVQGQTATSGMPPALLPGYLGPFGGPGYYRILGVPPGTYRLRISKEGYASQERSVTVEVGSPVADFQLTPM